MQVAHRLLGMRCGAVVAAIASITPSASFAAPALTLQRRGLSTMRPLLGSLIPYKLADIGEGITEVQVLNVRVKPGDTIREFDPICEVQSDKATVDITSRYSGVVKAVHIAQGQTAQVGQSIIDIEAGGEDSSAVSATAPESASLPLSAAAAAAAPEGASSAPVANAGIIPYKLADIGEGITEVQVLNVRVKPGDTIREFDPICEVQSDKATVDITSRYSGVVKAVYIETGVTAKVGSVIVDITPEKSEVTPSVPPSRNKVPTSSPAAASSAPPPPTATVMTQAGKVLATPATRYLAREHQLDLACVRATGKGGRITKEDVMRHLAGPSATSGAAPPSIPRPLVGSMVSGIQTEAEDTVVPIAGVRRGMVKSMTQAALIPTFNFSEEYELTRLMAARELLKGVVADRSRGKAKLSFMPFFVKAASLALAQHPDINAYCPEDCSVLIRKAAHNIGFAMDTPNGLIVPVVPHVEQKSIFEIAVAMQELIDRGKQNKLTTQDMTGGTFTLSNIGVIGATTTKPVQLPPQVAIGAIGRLQKLPRFDAKGNVYAANLVCISFTADHRVIDGATMVRFANTYKHFLENPAAMLLDLR